MASKLPVVQVLEPPPRRDGPIVLTRDCEATRIPSGSKVVFPAGTRVAITQSLGGQFTVTTEEGTLLRIADKDADALGERPAAACRWPKLPRPASLPFSPQESSKSVANGPPVATEKWPLCPIVDANRQRIRPVSRLAPQL